MNKSKIFITVFSLCFLSLISVHNSYGLVKHLLKKIKSSITSTNVKDSKKFSEERDKLISHPLIKDVVKVEGYPVVAIDIHVPEQPSVWRCGYYSVVFLNSFFKEISDVKDFPDSDKNIRKIVDSFTSSDGMQALGLRVNRLVDAMKLTKEKDEERQLDDVAIMNMFSNYNLLNKVLKGDKLNKKENKIWSRKIRSKGVFVIDYKVKFDTGDYLTCMYFYMNKVKKETDKIANRYVLEKLEVFKNIEESGASGGNFYFVVNWGEQKERKIDNKYKGSFQPKHFTLAAIMKHKGVWYIFNLDSLHEGIRESYHTAFFEEIAKQISSKELIDKTVSPDDERFPKELKSKKKKEVREDFPPIHDEEDFPPIHDEEDFPSDDEDDDEEDFPPIHEEVDETVSSDDERFPLPNG